jgi:hypothetical protein
VRGTAEQAVLADHPLVTVQASQQAESGPRAVYHRRRYRAIQRHYRTEQDTLQRLKQRKDLRPVGSS